MKSFALAALLGAVVSARNRKVSAEYPSYIPAFENGF